MKTQPKKHYHLFIRVVAKDQSHNLYVNGQKLINTEWIEVDEVSLGSMVKPDNRIIEIKFIPVRDGDGI